MGKDGNIQIPTDKVLVKIKSGLKINDALNSLNIDFESIRRLGYDKDSYIIQLKNGESIVVSNILFESGLFVYSQPSFTRFIEMANEFYPDQWGLNNTGQNGGTVGIDINGPEAWTITRGCSNIKIAVIDQGVDLDHPDLAGNLLPGYDATNGGSGGVNGDCWGNDAHGTCCAGIIAAINNTIGIVGVAHECNIIPIRVTYTSGGFEIWHDDWVVSAISRAWAYDNADVLSCSWVYTNVTAINTEISNALTYGRYGKGCVIVFAAGNHNTSVSYPANSNADIIAVGAMSPCGERKNPNSCDTENWGSNYGSQLDLIAPGVLIPTTDIQGTAGYNTSLFIHTSVGGDLISDDYDDDDYTVCFNGTSAATPHVAGVAALILSINPNLTQDQVRDIIESTCTKVGSYSYSTVTGRTNGTWNNQTGYGCVNAYAAVLKASGGNIAGSGVVCTSNTTFSLTGISGLNIDWDCSTSFLTQVGGDNGSSFVVHANSSSTIGQGWISVKIITDCGDTITRTKTVWVGSPSNSYLDFTVDGGSLILNDYVSAEADYNGPSSAQVTGFDWILKDAIDWEVTEESAAGPDNKYVEIEYWEYPCRDYEKVGIRAENTCGWSYFHYEMVPVDGCGYYMMMSPNPSSGETTLLIEQGSAEATILKSASSENTVDENTEWELEVYDNAQNLKEKKTKLKGKEHKLNTSTWKEGVYIVRVKYKDQILTDKLVVKK